MVDGSVTDPLIYTVVVFHVGHVSKQEKSMMMTSIDENQWRGFLGIVRGKSESVEEWNDRCKKHADVGKCVCTILLQHPALPLSTGFLMGLGKTVSEAINDWKHRIAYWVEQHPDFVDWPQPASEEKKNLIPTEIILKTFEWSPHVPF